MKQKRGISAVITTVLLILLSIMAIGIIAGVVVPMVRQSLGDAQDCFELRDYVTILASQKTCYNSGNTTLMISRGNDNKSIYGIAVTIYGQDQSKRFDLIDGQKTAGVTKYSSTAMAAFGVANLAIPGPGEAFTYVFNTSGSGGTANVAALTRAGKACDVSTLNIPSCADIR